MIIDFLPDFAYFMTWSWQISYISILFRISSSLSPKRIQKRKVKSQPSQFSVFSGALPLDSEMALGHAGCGASVSRRRHPLRYRRKISLQPTADILLVEKRHALKSIDPCFLSAFFPIPLNSQFVGIDECRVCWCRKFPSVSKFRALISDCIRHCWESLRDWGERRANLWTVWNVILMRRLCSNRLISSESELEQNQHRRYVQTGDQDFRSGSLCAHEEMNRNSLFGESIILISLGRPVLTQSLPALHPRPRHPPGNHSVASKMSTASRVNQFFTNSLK
jgi:hypothetical protein